MSGGGDDSGVQDAADSGNANIGHYIDQGRHTLSLMFPNLQTTNSRYDSQGQTNMDNFFYPGTQNLYTYSTNANQEINSNRDIGNTIASQYYGDGINNVNNTYNPAMSSVTQGAQTSANQLNPFITTGQQSLANQRNLLLGNGQAGVPISSNIGVGRVTSGANPFDPNVIGQGYQQSPGVAQQLKLGQQAINDSSSAQGNLLSGANLKAAQTFSQGVANQDYWNYVNQQQQGMNENTSQVQNAYNNLMGLTGTGLSAAGTAGQIGSTYAGVGAGLAGTSLTAQAGLAGLESGATSSLAGQTGATTGSMMSAEMGDYSGLANTAMSGAGSLASSYLGANTNAFTGFGADYTNLATGGASASATVSAATQAAEAQIQAANTAADASIFGSVLGGATKIFGF